ncbi:MAG: hypothetical protein MUC69_00290 [Gemmatimonadales bacterium]|jgi:hypothetical protein|nr:hypothetical protein [Gemmatimonadales bacterium]
MTGRALLLALAAGAVLLTAARGRAEDFFRVSPGPLSESHAALDSSDKCEACHRLGRGVTSQKCLDCHRHRRLRDAIARGEGLHAQFKGRPCLDCHTEHKGRDHHITDWKSLGGRTGFDHGRTGFPLRAYHANLACTGCHKARTASGRVSYLGLRRGCLTCHAKVHQFRRPALNRDCGLCHSADRVNRQLAAPDVPRFDHSQVARVPLLGRHQRTPCLKCHAHGRMSGREPPRGCVDCHRNPHGPVVAKRSCESCHPLDRPFKPARFRHDDTGYPLRARHARVSCGKCHRSASKPPRDCGGCHGKPHKNRFAELRCAQCHRVGGERKPHFDHERLARYPLRGAHRHASCAACHKGGHRPERYLRLTNVAQQGCTGCHRHARAHDLQFRNRACGECHLEGGTRSTPFDHTRETRFRLAGRHLPLNQPRGCIRCHPGKVYRTGKLSCADCHKDVHRGRLGRDCARCHPLDAPFGQPVFDHTGSTRFPLVGRHRQVKCASCHPNRTFRLGQFSCATCHARTDPHRGRLGSDCGKCHRPEKGAPRFRHATMTKFPLEGAHARVACGHCHQPPPATGPPKVGWTKGKPPPPRDLTFPVMGTRCAQCHHDKHDGLYGPECQSCHSQRSFKEVDRAVHRTGSFRLYGAHDRVTCKRCHERREPLTGLGRHCQHCHRDKDVHNNALGTECGRCHGQVGWRPARFSHAQTSVALRGAHRRARCRDCHGVGRYQGTPTSCVACHAADARRATSPPHTDAFNQCERCHTQQSFVPARYAHLSYPLRGAHRTVRCAACHATGTYVGTPTACESCHLARFSTPGNQPNHVAAGFSTRCQNCHRDGTWRPARYVHATFQLRGAHRALGCSRCHPGDSYRGAFGGLGWSCAACHGPGGPVSRWPAAHAARGYPLACEQCHSQSAWRPARRRR